MSAVERPERVSLRLKHEQLSNSIRMQKNASFNGGNWSLVHPHHCHCHCHQHCCRHCRCHCRHHCRHHYYISISSLVGFTIFTTPFSLLQHTTTATPPPFPLSRF